MRLDGVGLFAEDTGTMIRFYRDVLDFEIQEGEDVVEDVVNVSLGSTNLLHCRSGGKSY